MKANHIFPVKWICTINKMEGPLKGSRGKDAGSLKPATFEECEAACIANEECKSLLYSKGKEECSLKKLELTGTEAITKKNPKFFSAYKTCEIGKKLLHIPFFCTLEYK